MDDVMVMSQAERILEALAVYQSEKVKVQEWKEECTAVGRELPMPPLHPILVAMGDIKVCRVL